MTTTIYKLTDESMRTYGGYSWVLGEWRETDGDGELCGAGWLHAYTCPRLALFLNPIHANFSAPRLFRGEADGKFLDDRGLKVGYTRMRIVEELPVEHINLSQRVAFSILCALEACGTPEFVQWAEGWLTGRDRSSRAAYAADAAAYAARAAAYAADAAAAHAARAAAYAADAAAAHAARAAEHLNLSALADKAMEIV